MQKSGSPRLAAAMQFCLKEAMMEVKCWECGKQFERDLKSEWETLNLTKIMKAKEYEAPKPVPEKPWKRLYCAECEKEQREFVAETKRIYIKTKTLVTYERAIKMLERQGIDIYSYEEAIKKVEEYALLNPEKFDSSHEMIAAVVLIKNGVSVNPQYKIDKYRVDFYIPQYKCILEIDGALHKHQLLYDSNRDIKIRQLLGAEWEVVRVPTKHLEENASALVTAIKQLKRKKQEVRNANGGIIPSYYSKRDKAKSAEAERILKA